MTDPDDEEEGSKASPPASGGTEAKARSTLEAEEDQGQEEALAQRTHEFRLARYQANLALASASQLAYDKTVLTVASGALVLSITFVRHIAPEPVPVSVWVLNAGWASLVLCLMTTTTGMVLGSEGLLRSLAGTESQSKKWVQRADRLNIIMLGSLCLGLLLLAAFAGWNAVARPTAAPADVVCSKVR